MLEIVNCSKTFGSRTLWAAVNWTVQPGQMAALMGPSGSGKSTLLNCIGTLDNVSAGSISWKGQPISGIKERAKRSLRRRELGYLFQDYGLVESETVNRNISYGTGRIWFWQRDSYTSELEAVGLAGRGSEPVHVLSGGEQQRVAVARLMNKKPTLVLADEPTGSLDDANAVRVLDLLRTLADDGAAVVIATHSAMVHDVCTTCLHLESLPGEESCPVVSDRLLGKVHDE
ncbi:ABC transporter ATP-binding protein [Luteococcus sediminum]|uniref:ABC transporter ATP-binding protein n=1 Tax=Luteococcus sp. TaxID=1969402 RepID=UPI0037365DA4